MSPDEMMKMFGLGAPAEKPAAAAGLGIMPTSGGAKKKAAPTCPTAIEIDEWGMRRGRDLIDESERLRRTGVDEFAAADFHAAAFDPDPVFTDGCDDGRRAEFITQLLDTPECHALRADTMLDDTAAAIAATAFAEQFAVLTKDDAKREREGKPEGASPADEMGKEMAALRAVGRALAVAGEEVGEMKDAAEAMGMGAAGATDPAAVAAMFKRVRSDPTLKRICELAGRFRMVARSKQRTKVSHGFDDIVGVEPAGDIGRLLPMELAKLAVPELELDTLRRLVERQTLCRQYQSVEPVGKGPIIVCIDESGSMEGEKANTAKALALALAWVARSQKRWCGLVAYSGGSPPRSLTLPADRWDEGKLCDWLSAFIGYGSEIDVPVREMPWLYAEMGAPKGATDLIFLTDALCDIKPAVSVPFMEWKAAEKVRLITLVIGTRDPSKSGLAQISDECHAVPSLAATAVAVDRVLSI